MRAFLLIALTAPSYSQCNFPAESLKVLFSETSVFLAQTFCAR
jgi:hypothetical protein